MSETLAIVIRLLTPLLSAFCQLLLKKAATNSKYTGIRSYFNFPVIFGYFLFFACMLLNTLSLGKIDLTMSGILEASSYIYVMILSIFCLKEKITKRCFIGNLLILIGIVVSLLWK